MGCGRWPGLDCSVAVCGSESGGCGSSDWAVGRVPRVRCERRPGLVRWEVWELGAFPLVVVSLG